MTPTFNPASQIESRNPDASLQNEVIRDNALMTTSRLGVLARPRDVDVTSEAVWVPLSNAPSQLLGGIEVALDFVMPIRHCYIQNNTTATTIYVAFDEAIGMGGFLIAAGGWCRADLTIAKVSILPSATVNLNAAGGIVIKGER